MAHQEFFRLENIFNSSVAPIHRNANIDKIPESARGIISEWIENVGQPKDRGLLILGPVGCGKTSILALMLKHYLLNLDHRYDARIKAGEYFDRGGLDFVDKENRYGSLYDYIKFSFTTHAGIVKSLRDGGNFECEMGINHSIQLKDKLIFIDDFGRCYDDKSGWNIAVQDEYFDYLWRNRVPVYMTSNYTPNELEKMRRGELRPEWQRIIDRIMDASLMTRIVINEKSKRL